MNKIIQKVKMLIKFVGTIVLLLACESSIAQLSSDFFPSSIGFKWQYKLTPLDTLGNPIQALTTTRIDTYATKQIFVGKNANFVLSKPLNSPVYTDTNYIHLETTNGWLYTKLLPNMDSIPIFDTLGLIKFFRNFIGWHSYFRFAQPTNIEYTISSRDTTIIINSAQYPIRVKISGIRFNDENINLPIGNLLCKKFVIKYSINYLIFSLELPIIVIPDTNWISNGLWIVKKMTPPVKIDLSFLNLGKYFLLGQALELQEYFPLSVNLADEYNFKLYQNYPNPFNYTTTIQYEVGKKGNVKIEIFDINGRRIDELINSIHTPGIYQIKYVVDNLSSCVYFYKITTDEYIETKKLTLIK